MTSPEAIDATYCEVLAIGSQRVLLDGAASEEQQYLSAQILVKELAESKDEESIWNFLTETYAQSHKPFSSVSLKLSSVLTSIICKDHDGAITRCTNALQWIAQSVHACHSDPNSVPKIRKALFALMTLEDLNKSCLSVPLGEFVQYPDHVLCLRDVIRETEAGHILIKVLTDYIAFLRSDSYHSDPSHNLAAGMSIKNLTMFIIWVPMELLISLSVIDTMNQYLVAEDTKRKSLEPFALLAVRTLMAKGMSMESKEQIVGGVFLLLEEHVLPRDDGVLDGSILPDMVDAIIETTTEIMNQVTRLFSDRQSSEVWSLVQRSLGLLLRVLALSSKFADSRAWTLSCDLRPQADEFWAACSQLMRKFVALYAGCPSTQPHIGSTLETRGGANDNIHHRKYKSQANLPCEEVRTYAGSSVKYPLCHPMTEDIADTVRAELFINIPELRPYITLLLDQLMHQYIVQLVHLGPDDEDQPKPLLDCIRMVLALDPEATSVNYVCVLWESCIHQTAQVSHAVVYTVIKMSIILVDHYKDISKLMKNLGADSSFVSGWKTLGNLVIQLNVKELALNDIWRGYLLDTYYELEWKLLLILIPHVWAMTNEANQYIRHLTMLLCSSCGVLDHKRDPALMKSAANMILKLCKSYAVHLASASAIGIIGNLLNEATIELPDIELARIYEALGRLVFSAESGMQPLERKQLLMSIMARDDLEMTNMEQLARNLRCDVGILKYWDGLEELLGGLLQRIERATQILRHTVPFNPLAVDLIVCAVSSTKPIARAHEIMDITMGGIEYAIQGDMMDEDHLSALNSIIKVLPLPIERTETPEEAKDAVVLCLASDNTVQGSGLDRIISKIVSKIDISLEKHQRMVLEPLFLACARLYGSPIHCKKAVSEMIKEICVSCGRLTNVMSDLLFNPIMTSLIDSTKLTHLQMANEVIPIRGYLDDNFKKNLAANWLTEVGQSLVSSIPKDTNALKILREQLSLCVRICGAIPQEDVLGLMGRVLNHPGWLNTAEGRQEVDAFVESSPYFTGDLGSVERWRRIFHNRRES